MKLGRYLGAPPNCDILRQMRIERLRQSRRRKARHIARIFKAQAKIKRVHARVRTAAALDGQAFSI